MRDSVKVLNELVRLQISLLKLSHSKFSVNGELFFIGDSISKDIQRAELELQKAVKKFKTDLLALQNIPQRGS